MYKAIALCLLAFAPTSVYAQSLADKIDALILAGAGEYTPSSDSEDGEFLRRIWLDLAGRIPPLEVVDAFFADPSSDKRGKMIDRLLAGDDLPDRLADRFNIVLMERLGDHPAWSKWLKQSFRNSEPWDGMVRDILAVQSADAKRAGASYFLSKRLENYGQNAVDYPGLTRDLGRLFLGINLQCAQCHDHLTVAEYKQSQFQGLFAYVQNATLLDEKAMTIGEKPTVAKLDYQSVFRKVPKQTAPAIPGRAELAIPTIAKGEEYAVKPDAKTKAAGKLKFSPLDELAKELPRRDNPRFVHNIVNRVWFIVMGRGLVHPLDLFHSDNPASHPELLELLSKEFVAHDTNVRWLIGELVRTKTYQRSSRVPSGKEPPPESFLTMAEKRLSPEQLLHSVLEATGERTRSMTAKSAADKTVPLDLLRAKFVKAFAGPAREPEEEVSPSLKAALYLLNDTSILSLLQPETGNRMSRLAGMKNDSEVVKELYRAILSRDPSSEESKSMSERLRGTTAQIRTKAIGQMMWAMLASMEFSVNH